MHVQSSPISVVPAQSKQMQKGVVKTLLAKYPIIYMKNNHWVLKFTLCNYSLYEYSNTLFK